ncbi:hypothetical protein [Sinorhizobium fredii]|uniref:hypothetical protein n=1 Tax=Rhizobium fredii TaxID=380 RepID=UPI0033982283
MVRDPVQEKLLDIIETKRKATKTVKAAKPKGGEPAERGNIIDLMSALKQSLEGKSRAARPRSEQQPMGKAPVRNGRARLALALPRHREQLRRVKSRELVRLFEAYARAAMRIEELRYDPDREGHIPWYESLCLDMQAEAVELLEKTSVHR